MAIIKGEPLDFTMQAPGAVAPVTAKLDGVAIAAPVLVAGTNDSYTVSLTDEQTDVERAYLLVTDADGEEYGVSIEFTPPPSPLLENLDAAITSRPTLAQIQTAIAASAVDYDLVTAAVEASDLTAQVQAVDDKLVNIGYLDVPVSSRAAGAGDIGVLYTYTVTSQASGAPIAGVAVVVTSDLAGLVPVAEDTTDGNGQAAFQLEAGTYYFWRSRSGFTFTNPDIEVVG